MKIIWKVTPEETGRFASFHKRSWPMACYAGETQLPCAYVTCEDSYSLRRATTGKHGSLTLRLANHSNTPWTWMVARRKFNTLKELKEALPGLLEKNKFLVPKELA